MENMKFDPAKYYRVTFVDGSPIDFRFICKDVDNGSILCVKKGGETFYLDNMKPYDKIVELESW